VWRVAPAGIVGADPYIEGVFENDLVELDAAGTLAAAEANEHTLTTAETRRLLLAAHWADLHPGDAVPSSRIRGAERPVRLGGPGTPTVAEFAPAELGAALSMSAGSAARLIGDALDLRHRSAGSAARLIGDALDLRHRSAGSAAPEPAPGTPSGSKPPSTGSPTSSPSSAMTIP
jgi:hypothetical protein